MPVKDILQVNENCQVGIWELKEDAHNLLSALDLSKEEGLKFQSFKNERRKEEWLAIRCLLNKMDESAFILYNENGKPRLKDNISYISLSHTRGWVSIILQSKHHVGCDIEILSEKVIRIKNKFASTKEIENSPYFQNKIHYYTLIWCAKEAIYKLFSDIEILEFKTQIEVKLPFELRNCGNLNAEVQFKNEKRNIALNYNITDEYILVYTLNE